MENLVRVANHEAYSPRYGLDMGDTYESVTVEIKDHVAQVTLIGPGKGNAMGPASVIALIIVVVAVLLAMGIQRLGGKDAGESQLEGA